MVTESKPTTAGSPSTASAPGAPPILPPPAPAAAAPTAPGAPPVLPAPQGAWPVGTQPLPPDRRSFKLWGDPHVVAGDGKKFDNEQVGTITQMKSASGDFELQTTQEHPPGKPHVTVNTSAAVKAGNDVVSYDVTRKALVVNHKEVQLADGHTMKLPDGGTLARDAKGDLAITTPKGDVVNIRVAHMKKDGNLPFLNIDGHLGDARMDNEVRGAMGDFHAGNAANGDFVGRDGKTYDANFGHGNYKSMVSKDTYNKANVEAFEKSWMVGGKGLLQENQGKGTEAHQWAADAVKLEQKQAHERARSGIQLPNAPAGNDRTYNIGGPQPAVMRQGHYIGEHIAKQFDAMVAAAKRDGVDLEIESGYRTYAEQEQLWHQYGEDPARVARPGTSNHEKGNAIDYKNTPGAWTWLKQHATEFGFHNYPPEPWHYSLDGH